MGSKKSEKKKHRHKDREEEDERRKKESKDENHKESKRRSEKDVKGKRDKERSRSRKGHSSDEEDNERKRSKRYDSSDDERQSRKKRSRRRRSSSSSDRSKSPPSERRSPVDEGRVKVPAEDLPDGGDPVVTSGGDNALSIEETNKLRAKLGLRPLDVGPEPISRPVSTASESIKTKGDGELSIEETNKLRAELGLKPLDVGDGQGEEQVSKKTDVHVPAKNIGDEKRTKKLQEKLLEMRRRRQMERKLNVLKGLGEVEEDETASSWVERMKAKEEEKKMAQERARMLEEMDEEFGVDSLIKDSLKDKRQKAYSSKDLSGLKVDHKGDSFSEGQTVILTLKDAPVLDQDGDILENVNIVDEEKASRNIELKKKSLGYEGYQDEFDEMGMLKEKKILSKYDEEIEGIKKETLILGDSGSYSDEKEKEHRLIQQRLSLGTVSLETAPAQIAREYYTEEEMVKFKKPKKKKKVKKTVLKADDLVPLDGGEGGGDEALSRDHGSRGVRHRHDDDEEEPFVEMEDVKPIITEEEDKAAVDRALRRTRQILERKKTSGMTGAEKVAEMVSTALPIKEEPLFSSEAIVLDTTAEFCRQLGEETVQAVTRKASVSAQIEKMDVATEGEESRGNWEEVAMDTESEPTEKDLYQELEPVVSSGMIAALQMASRKGFIDGKDAVKEMKRNELIKRVDREERGRERDRRERDRDPYSFPEKKDYNPKIKITYTDDFGRELQEKEAFRVMSHKFHGKGSGRKKTEKRLKRRLEEFDLLSADTADTPLNTLRLLQEKQKSTNSPYLVVSGGQAANTGISSLSKSKT